jgi:hypothetical protein
MRKHLLTALSALAVLLISGIADAQVYFTDDYTISLSGAASNTSLAGGSPSFVEPQYFYNAGAGSPTCGPSPPNVCAADTYAKITGTIGAGNTLGLTLGENTDFDGTSWFNVNSAVSTAGGGPRANGSNGTVTVTFYNIGDGTDTECVGNQATATGGCSVSVTIQYTYNSSTQHYDASADLTANPLYIYFPDLSAYLELSFLETDGTSGGGYNIGEGIEATYTSTPEPTSLTLFGAALAGLAAFRLRRRSRG